MKHKQPTIEQPFNVSTRIGVYMDVLFSTEFMTVNPLLHAYISQIFKKPSNDLRNYFGEKSFEIFQNNS